MLALKIGIENPGFYMKYIPYLLDRRIIYTCKHNLILNPIQAAKII